MTEAALASLSGGLGVLSLGLLAMVRNGNGKNGKLEAKMDEALLVLREIATILKMGGRSG